MTHILNKIDHNINAIIAFLDQFRQFVLRASLKNHIICQIYSSYQYRTFFSIMLLISFILPISVLRPDLLLIMGPLVFGYPHMIASYRYLIQRDLVTEQKRPLMYFLFCFFTVITIFVYNFKLFQTWMSFGVWPQVLSIFVLIFAYQLNFLRNRKTLVAGILLSSCFLIFAWQEPLLYAGGILMLHNFVAFFHWICNCRNWPQRRLALLCLGLFLMIHGFVVFGGIDFYLNPSLLKQWGVENTAWFLASWSEDPLIWYRWLVLYTFGLSIHYLIWLRAIPEAEIKSGKPFCFRMSYKAWQKDIGQNVLKLSLFICVLGIGLWLFKYNLGKSIYFQIALLHGALEISFLPSKIKLLS